MNGHYPTIDPAQLDEIEQRARRMLAKGSRSDEERRALELIIAYLNHVRQCVVDDDLEHAHEWLNRVGKLDLEARFSSMSEARSASTKSLKPRRRTVTDEQIIAAIESHATNLEAARALGIGERALYNRLRKLRN